MVPRYSISHGSPPSAAAAPVEAEVAVQVSPAVGTGYTAVVFVGVLAPDAPPSASLRPSGRHHDVIPVVIQKPMAIRDGLVILNQVSGKAAAISAGGIPAYGRCDEQLGFVLGDRFVGQAQDAHIVAVRLPDALLPGSLTSVHSARVGYTDASAAP